MRFALFITLVLAFLVLGYSFIGESRVWKRYSEERAALADWRRQGHSLPENAGERMDGIILSMRKEWRVVRWLGIWMSVAVCAELWLRARAKNARIMRLRAPFVGN